MTVFSSQFILGISRIRLKRAVIFRKIEYKFLPESILRQPSPHSEWYSPPFVKNHQKCICLAGRGFLFILRRLKNSLPSLLPPSSRGGKEITKGKGGMK